MKESVRKYQVLTQEQRAYVLDMKSQGMKNKEISISMNINLKTVASVKSTMRKSEYGEIKQALLQELKNSDSKSLNVMKLVKRKIREMIENPVGQLKQIIGCFNNQKNELKSTKRTKKIVDEQQVLIKAKIAKQVDKKYDKNLEFTTQNRKIIEQVALKYLKDTRQQFKSGDQMIEESNSYQSQESQQMHHDQSTELESIQLNCQLNQLSLDDHRQEPLIPVENFLQEWAVPVYDIWGELIYIKNGSEESFMNGSKTSFMNGSEESFSQ